MFNLVHPLKPLAPSHSTIVWRGLMGALNWLEDWRLSVISMQFLYMQFLKNLGIFYFSFQKLLLETSRAITEHYRMEWLNPFMPTVAFNICCPRDCVSRHNGGTAGAPLKPLRDDSALYIYVCDIDICVFIYERNFIIVRFA